MPVWNGSGKPRDLSPSPHPALPMISSLIRFLPLFLLGVVPVAWAKPPSTLPTGVATLDLYADGSRLHLLVAETTAAGEIPLLHYLSTDEGQSWEGPHPLATGQPAPFAPHRGFDPQIAAQGDSLVAAWTTAGTDRFGSGPIATARSQDGGRSWEAGPNPADDGLTTGHGFLDLAVGPDRSFHLVWLDSRDGRQGLRYTRSSDQGKTWVPNFTLQAGTCECCRNTLALDLSGQPAVLYRDHHPRDMKLIQAKNGVWQSARIAGAFRWEFDGCPHAGGGLAFTASGGHALVWTGREEQMGVHHIPPDGPSQRLGDDSALHPDLAASAEGVLLAVWQQSADEGSASPLRYSLSKDEGRQWSPPRAIPEAGSRATHPRAVALPGSFVVAWTETPEAGVSQWRTVRLPLP